MDEGTGFQVGGIEAAPGGEGTREFDREGFEAILTRWLVRAFRRLPPDEGQEEECLT